MNVASAIASLNPFRGVDPRPEPEIDDELDAEFAFHLDQLEHELVASGELPADARRRALERFGDVGRLKSECRTIALKERQMLQKVNFVLTLFLTLAILGVGLQMYLSQRSTALALSTIVERLEAQSATAPASAPDTPVSLDATVGRAANLPGTAYIDGLVTRPGQYQISMAGGLTLRRLVTAAGAGTHQPAPNRATLHRDVGGARVSIEIDLSAEPTSTTDPLIQHNDYIILSRQDDTPGGAVAQNPGGPDVTNPAAEPSAPKLTNNPPAPIKVQPDVRIVELRSSAADPVTLELPAAASHTFNDIITRYSPPDGFFAFVAGFRQLHGRWTTDAGLHGYVGDRGEIAGGNAPLRHGDILYAVMQPWPVDDAGVPKRDRFPDVRPSFVFVTGDVDRQGPQQLKNEGDTLLHEIIAEANPHIVEGEHPRWIYLLRAADRSANWIAIPGEDLFGLNPKPIVVRSDDLIQVAFTALHDENRPANASAGVPLLENIPLLNNPNAPSPTRPNVAKISPFEELRWANEWEPVGRVRGTWYRINAINEIPVADILDHARTHHPRKERKRFGEDLLQLFDEMGRPLSGNTVSLDLTPADGGDPIRLDDVPMSDRNRDRIRELNNQHDGLPVYPPASRSSKLTPEQIDQDLAALHNILLRRFSYLNLSGIDAKPLLDTIRTKAPNGIDRAAFALQIHKAICRFGDAHSGVDNLPDYLTPGYLDILIEDSADRGLVALKPDRSSFLDPNHPTIAAIDGVPIDKWLAAAAAIVPEASPQSIRRRSIRSLASIEHLRRELGLPTGLPARLELLGDNDARVNIEVAVSMSPPAPRRGWLTLDSQLLFTPDRRSIGYLRLEEMDSRAADEVRAMMQVFKDTDGLIIDVRGNGGGTRDALQAFFPYLLQPGAVGHVANIAFFNADEFPADHLAARSLYPADDARWTFEQRALIGTALEQSKGALAEQCRRHPDATPHVLLLSPADNPDAFHYHKPVVVLMDAGCFSATDIFLGALKGWPNVTLMGQSSSGGSGRVMTHSLPNSQVKLRLSSMISYRPTGELYDLAGIPPDVEAAPLATDFLGQSDTMLKAALKHFETPAKE